MKNILKIIFVFIVSIGGGIFADQILWPYFIERPLFYRYRLDQAPVYVTQQITIEENVALQAAIEKVEKAVIGIKTVSAKGKIVKGSGVIVSADGLIVTFSDLVPATGKTTLFWEGRMFAFQVLKRDEKENLVLLKIEETNLPTVGFADTGKIHLGERMFLLGMVFAAEDINLTAPQKTVNEGIVKSISGNFLETNIIEKIGLKGSPLFNISGELVGLNLINEQGNVSCFSISRIKEFIGL
ncbi:MAG: serine protease [bacterium]